MKPRYPHHCQDCTFYGAWNKWDFYVCRVSVHPLRIVTISERWLSCVPLDRLKREESDLFHQGSQWPHALMAYNEWEAKNES